MTKRKTPASGPDGLFRPAPDADDSAVVIVPVDGKWIKFRMTGPVPPRILSADEYAEGGPPKDAA